MSLSASPISQTLIPEEPQSDRRTRPQLITFGLIALLLVYFVIVVTHASYAVGGSDSSGYANLARSLLHGRILVPVREVQIFGVDESLGHIFTPLGYTTMVKDGKVTGVMLPFYPIGLPLHEDLGVLLLGWRFGPFVISPLLATLSCWLIYCIGRMLGLSQPLAAVGSLLLAINPTFIFLAEQPMSDGPSTFWGLLSIWAALRSREHAAWMLLAGFAFGVNFLVRPTNILFLAPLLFCVPFKPRAIALFVFGGLPLAAVFLSYNYTLFGNALQTGYGTIGLLDQFDLRGVTSRFSFYVYWMAATMSPLVLAGWLGSAFLRTEDWKRRALLIAWFVPFILLYSTYSFYDAWWYTRFLLPAYPALILGTLLTAQSLRVRLRGSRPVLRWAVCILGFAVLFWVPLKYVIRHDLLSFGGGESLHAESCRWADKQLPPQGVIFSWEMSGALHFYTDRLIIRYERVPPSLWPTLRRRVEESGREFYALLMDGELELARKSVPGYWTELGHIRHIGLWRIDALDHEPSAVKYGDGFDSLEGNPAGVSWRWMSTEGFVQLRNTGRAMRLRIEGNVPVEAFARPQRINVLLNGTHLETVAATERNVVREYRITAAQQRQGEWSELRLIADQAMTPNSIDSRNPDKRRLSFSLTRLVWEEMPR